MMKTVKLCQIARVSEIFLLLLRPHLTCNADVCTACNIAIKSRTTLMHKKFYGSKCSAMQCMGSNDNMVIPFLTVMPWV